MLIVYPFTHFSTKRNRKIQQTNSKNKHGGKNPEHSGKKTRSNKANKLRPEDKSITKQTKRRMELGLMKRP